MRGLLRGIAAVAIATTLSSLALVVCPCPMSASPSTAHRCCAQETTLRAAGLDCCAAMSVPTPPVTTPADPSFVATTGVLAASEPASLVLLAVGIPRIPSVASSPTSPPSVLRI